MLKIFLILSLLCNLLLLSVIGYFIHTKGGYLYLMHKLHLMKKPEKVWEKDSEYLNKETIYDILPVQKNKIVFLGDSIISRCDWRELFNDCQIYNRGIGGDTTNGVLLRLNKIIESKPKQIFLYVGGNDLYRKRKHVENTKHLIKVISYSYEKILNKIIKESSDTELFILSIIPVNSNWDYVTVTENEIRALNSSLELLAEKFNAKYIDLYSGLKSSDNQLDLKFTNDGLHLNGKGYMIFRDVIKPYLK